ncbi:MAG TPA: MFS transporter [Acidimicrobiia bacterium]|nr:MFS transporter [Acidimicrobiia bacterium]
MRGPVRLTVEAPPTAVEEVVRRTLGLRRGSDGSLTGPLPDWADPNARVRVVIEPEDTDRAQISLNVEDEPHVPYFQWFFGPILRRGEHRTLQHRAALVAAEAEGRPPPPPPKRSPLLPPVPFPARATALLATVAAIAALANFGGALFGQTADSVTNTFGASNRGLGLALAVSRGGVLVSLVATALSDRQGRRRLLLICFAGVGITNAISAIAPGFVVFTGAQVLTRAFVNSTLVVSGIAAVEEAPEGARAYALSMLALAYGAGFAIAVVLLPISDIAPQSWRIVFAISALSVLLLPRLARNLQETNRYADLARRTQQRGQLREVFAKAYGFRFGLLALAAFLTNFFSAPSSQLMNRFLTDEHGFSNTLIAVFRGVTGGLPGLIGIVVAARLAETRGRRPVAIFALAAASLLQMAFFLGGGVVLWVTATFAIIAASCAAIVLVAFDTELFPTEVRGTSNALLLVCGVAGSAAGLLVATNLDDVLGGLGPAIAVCGFAPLLAAVFVLPWLPEPADRTLDEVSPSEV